MSRYTYINSADYISNLNFHYIETYSLQRGPEFEENQKLLQAEFDGLKFKKENGVDLDAEKQLRFTELNALLGFTQYLLNEKGQLHPSARKTNTFKNGDPAIERITTILKTGINTVPNLLCAPVYRDSIIFYNNNNEIVSNLNICLDCLYMETSMFNHVRGDFQTYDLLKRFFIEAGHDVEDPDQFFMDEISKMTIGYKKQTKGNQ